LVVVRTAKGGAYALEMEVVARLLLVEARVVDGPFFLGGRAHVVVDALVMFVQGDVALWCACGEIVGNVGPIFGLSRCLLCCVVEADGNVLEGAFVAETTKALVVLVRLV
jgi:hypothetical protein